MALWGRAIPTLTYGTNLKAFLGIFLCCCRTFAEECIDPWMLCLAGEALEPHAITIPVLVDQPSQVVCTFLLPFLAVWAGAPIRTFDVFVCFALARNLSPDLKIPLFNLYSFLPVRKKSFASDYLFLSVSKIPFNFYPSCL